MKNRTRGETTAILRADTALRMEGLPTYTMLTEAWENYKMNWRDEIKFHLNNCDDTQCSYCAFIKTMTQAGG